MTFRSSSRTVFQSDRPAASSSAPGRSLNGTGAQRSSSDEPVLKTVICLDLHSLGHRSRFRSVRDTSLARRCESKRCVRRDRRWNKNWPPPPGRLEKPVQPSNRDRLWIESCEPRERTDLGPDTTCGACHDLCVPEVVRLFCRSGEQEQWECSKSWR